MNSRTKVALFVGAALLVFAAVFLPDRWLLEFAGRVRDAGVAGVLVYTALYVIATLTLVPASVLTLGAGLAYGPFWGTMLVSPVSVFASTLAFLIGRTVARAWVERRMRDRPRFEAIDDAVARSGFRMVLLLRLSPVVPFNLLNYALGLTRVRLRDYVAASAVGMLPGTALYVYLGSLATTVSDLGEGKGTSPWAAALYWVGLVATLLVAVTLTRVARQGLRDALDAQATDAAHPASDDAEPRGVDPRRGSTMLAPGRFHKTTRPIGAREPRDAQSPTAG